MGIDPSLSSTGYALINFDSHKIEALAYGEIKTETKQNLPDRLTMIYQSLSDLVENYRPHELAIEEVFYAANPQIALKMGHVRGVSIVAASQYHLPIAEYSAKEIKMATTGFGNASKEQVRRMVLSQVKIDSQSIGYDISDAFAVAICHCHRNVQKFNRSEMIS